MVKDSETTVEELKEKIKRFCDERQWDQYHNAKDLAIGIITEAAELLEHFRFKNAEETLQSFENKETREEISDELADVLIFALRLAQKYGIDVSRAVENKLEKNAEKYPVELARGSNKKYSELGKERKKEE